jgi:hypothetical protein
MQVVDDTTKWQSLHSCQAEVPHQHPDETPRQLSRRRLIRLTAAAAGLTLLPSVAERQAFSQAPKSIRFIVPFPPGGGADLLMHVLAEQIGRSAGEATVVENRPGAASAPSSSHARRRTAAPC